VDPLLQEGKKLRWAIPAEEGPNKVCELKEAIGKHVNPGMWLHVAHFHYRPSAAINELIRQFWGQHPDFILSTVSVRENLVVLLYGGLVRQVISTFCGDVYPSPAPNPIVQAAYLQGKVEFENWSLLTIVQGFMAAAMGLDFVVTRSLLGSTMEEENKKRGRFQVIPHPDDGRKKLGLIRAFEPDITFLHGWAADRAGNTIILPPYGEDVWSAMAARKGAIVTVEKIVSTEFIRKHSCLVRLPAPYVLSVSPAPLGAHPYGMYAAGVEEFEVYAEDYDFMADLRRAMKEPARLEGWVKKWVLGCPTQSHYLDQLGEERICVLKGKGQAGTWEFQKALLGEEDQPGRESNSIERMVVCASEIVEETVLGGKFDTILAGVGFANLAAWLAHYTLKQMDHPVELTAEVGFYGYRPRPGDPFIFNFANISTCKQLTEILHILGSYLREGKSRCLGVLGAGQIDKQGNINSTLIPNRTFLVGSGGANDAASLAGEIVAVARQSKESFVEKVPYITSPGERVKTLISDLGVFKKRGEEKDFTLTAYFPSGSLGEKEILSRIESRCGWRLRVDSNLRVLPPPSREKIILLRSFDPRGDFIGGGKSSSSV